MPEKVLDRFICIKSRVFNQNHGITAAKVSHSKQVTWAQRPLLELMFSGPFNSGPRGFFGTVDFGLLTHVLKSAFDAVDGSHHRHLGAKVRLLLRSGLSPIMAQSVSSARSV